MVPWASAKAGGMAEGTSGQQSRTPHCAKTVPDSMAWGLTGLWRTRRSPSPGGNRRACHRTACLTVTWSQMRQVKRSSLVRRGESDRNHMTSPSSSSAALLLAPVDTSTGGSGGMGRAAWSQDAPGRHLILKEVT